MMYLYDHKFTIAKGHQVFVPSAGTSIFGSKICEWLFKKWSPPIYFFHLREGGHVAAANQHISDTYFLKLDLKNFFDSVTRTKIARSLRRVGFSSRDAFHFAQRSTVEKTKGKRDFSLPYGFPQSPALASLALHKSALGKALGEIYDDSSTYRLSVYMDDIIISTSTNSAVLDDALLRLEAASAAASLGLNESKTQGPATLITAFNIHITNGGLTIRAERMAEFKTALKIGNRFQVDGIINYVNSVNPAQANLLSDPM